MKKQFSKKLKFIIFFIITVAVVSSCEKKNDYQDRTLIIKSISLGDREIFKFYYDSLFNLISIEEEVCYQIADGYDFWWPRNYYLHHNDDGVVDYLRITIRDTSISYNNIPDYFTTGFDGLRPAIYNEDGLFCWFPGDMSGYIDPFSFSFSPDEKLTYMGNNDYEIFFNYDHTGNLTDFSKHKDGNILENHVFKFDTGKNPFFQFAPYWGIWLTSDGNYWNNWNKFITFSPNNRVKLTINGMDYRTYKYKYNDSRYPIKCITQDDNGNELTYTYCYFEFSGD